MINNASNEISCSRFLKSSISKPKLNENKRIDWIDLAKGLCICLVVLHHLSWDLAGSTLMIQIRMPLYFILSGIFFKDYGGGVAVCY